MAKYIDSNGLSHLIGKIKGWAVPQTRKINNKPLSADISLTPSDIGAAASGDLSSYVPTTRKVNGKVLSTDISLTASDVGALPSDTIIPSPGTGSNLPKMDGTSSLGSSDGYARVDHIHPTDTSRQATLVSGTNIKTIGSQSLLGSGNLTAVNIGAAASNHTHGDITNAGDITATAPTIASGDKLIINDESESKITNGPSFGTSTTTFLANNGTWQTPIGTTYSDFVGCDGADSGSHGLVPAPSSNEDNHVLFGDGDWDTLSLGAAVDGQSQGGIILQRGDPSSAIQGTFVALPTATSSQTGAVKLSDSTDSTSAASGKTAATPKAVKDALDAAKAYADNNDADTKNTAGSTDSSSKLFIIGATGQAASPQTYSQDTAYVGTDGHLYSDSKQVVNLSGTQAITNKTYNGYTLGAACAKGVDTSISSGSTSTSLPTTAAVADYVDNAVTVASSGALTYKGTVSAETGITNMNYKQGWYWIVVMPNVNTSYITIGGTECEAGDMIIAKQDKTTTLANDIDIIQSNISVIGNTEIDTIWTNASAS